MPVESQHQTRAVCDNLLTGRPLLLCPSTAKARTSTAPLWAGPAPGPSVPGVSTTLSVGAVIILLLGRKLRHRDVQ